MVNSTVKKLRAEVSALEKEKKEWAEMLRKTVDERNEANKHLVEFQETNEAISKAGKQWELRATEAEGKLKQLAGEKAILVPLTPSEKLVSVNIMNVCKDNQIGNPCDMGLRETKQMAFALTHLFEELKGM